MIYIMRIREFFRFSKYIQISNGRLVHMPLFLKNNIKIDKEKEKEKEKNDSEKKEGFPWE